MITMYDQNSLPISLEEWAKQMERHRFLARSKVGHHGVKKIISTVWCGMKDGIFETGIFTSQFKFVAIYARYTTKAEAQAGHSAACRRYRYNRRQRRRHGEAKN